MGIFDCSIAICEGKGIKKVLNASTAFRTPIKILASQLGTPSGIRTLDPLIKSQLLYQLS